MLPVSALVTCWSSTETKMWSVGAESRVPESEEETTARDLWFRAPTSPRGLLGARRRDGLPAHEEGDTVLPGITVPQIGSAPGTRANVLPSSLVTHWQLSAPAT